MGKSHRSEEEEALIITDFIENKPLTEIYSNWKISIKGLKSILRKNDIKMREGRGYDRKRKVLWNENFFNEFNPDTAYWAGFIYADGCLG